MKTKIFANDPEIYAYYEEFTKDLNQRKLKDSLVDLAKNQNSFVRLTAVPISPTKIPAEANPLGNDSPVLTGRSSNSDAYPITSMDTSMEIEARFPGMEEALRHVDSNPSMEE